MNLNIVAVTSYFGQIQAKLNVCCEKNLDTSRNQAVMIWGAIVTSWKLKLLSRGHYQPPEWWCHQRSWCHNWLACACTKWRVKWESFKKRRPAHVGPGKPIMNNIFLNQLSPIQYQVFSMSDITWNKYFFSIQDLANIGGISSPTFDKLCPKRIPNWANCYRKMTSL